MKLICWKKSIISCHFDENIIIWLFDIEHIWHHHVNKFCIIRTSLNPFHILYDCVYSVNSNGKWLSFNIDVRCCLILIYLSYVHIHRMNFELSSAFFDLLLHHLSAHSFFTSNHTMMILYSKASKSNIQHHIFISNQLFGHGIRNFEIFQFETSTNNNKLDDLSNEKLFHLIRTFINGKIILLRVTRLHITRMLPFQLTERQIFFGDKNEILKRAEKKNLPTSCIFNSKRMCSCWRYDTEAVENHEKNARANTLKPLNCLFYRQLSMKQESRGKTKKKNL